MAKYRAYIQHNDFILDTIEDIEAQDATEAETIGRDQFVVNLAVVVEEVDESPWAEESDE